MSERFFDPQDFSRSPDGQVQITEVGYENCIQLCSIIINKHFPYINSSDREDLHQVGLLKIIELLSKGHFDFNKGSLKTFLYTGVRNEMSNYLYRQRKHITVEDTFITSFQDTKEHYNSLNSLHIIDPSSLKVLFDDLKVSEKESVAILYNLSALGFEIQGFEIENKEYDFEHDMLTALVIWYHVKTMGVGYGNKSR